MSSFSSARNFFFLDRGLSHDASIPHCGGQGGRAALFVISYEYSQLKEFCLDELEARLRAMQAVTDVGYVLPDPPVAQCSLPAMLTGKF